MNSTPSVFHYTDKEGWNAIRSQAIWRFAASQPKDPSRPFGAYFTDIPPTPMNLKTLCKRIRVPNSKVQYVFWFTGLDGLNKPNDGRGRDDRIYFCPADYEVTAERQRYDGATADAQERLP